MQRFFPKEKSTLMQTLLSSLKDGALTEIESESENDTQCQKLNSFMQSHFFKKMVSRDDRIALNNFNEIILAAKEATKKFKVLLKMIDSNLQITDAFFRKLSA